MEEITVTSSNQSRENKKTYRSGRIRFPCALRICPDLCGIDDFVTFGLQVCKDEAFRAAFGYKNTLNLTAS